MNVVDTSVTNNNATVVTGTVVASADGRLRRTLANGQVQGKNLNGFYIYVGIAKFGYRLIIL